MTQNRSKSSVTILWQGLHRDKLILQEMLSIFSTLVPSTFFPFNASIPHRSVDPRGLHPFFSIALIGPEPFIDGVSIVQAQLVSNTSPLRVPGRVSPLEFR